MYLFLLITWLSPRMAGGLGLLHWTGNVFISNKGNKIPVNFFETLDVDFNFINQSLYTREYQMQHKYKKYGITLNDMELSCLLKINRLEKVASDDVPGLMSIVRFHYRKFLRGLQFRKISDSIYSKTLDLMNCVYYNLQYLSTLLPCKNALQLLENKIDLQLKVPFGKYKHLTEKLLDLFQLARIRNEPLRNVLIDYPDFLRDCRLLEKKLKLKHHVAIEWLTTGISLECNYKFHPSVIAVLSKYCALLVSQFWGRITSCDVFTILWYSISNNLLINFELSKLSKLFYSY